MRKKLKSASKIKSKKNSFWKKAIKRGDYRGLLITNFGKKLLKGEGKLFGSEEIFEKQKKRAFLKINGVGEVKLEKYGEIFLEKLKILKQNTLSETAQKTLDLISEGKSIQEIAKIRELSEATILNHLKIISNANKIDSNTKQKLIDDYLLNIPETFKNWYKEGIKLIDDFKLFKSYLYALNRIEELLKFEK